MTKTKFEIKSWLTGEVLYSGDHIDIKEALEEAVAAGANLYGANLVRANLYGANLDGDTTLETGETWKEYLEATLPALLTAGGKTIEEVASHWDCHDWHNCPMAFAFGVESESQCPILLRPRVRQFVRMFDAGLVPNPIADADAASCQAKTKEENHE